MHEKNHAEASGDCDPANLHTHLSLVKSGTEEASSYRVEVTG
jgi:hypothetical protein